jgi:3-oxoacyl-[acyl-carrier protein] reductase
MESIKNQNILITGASRGIGKTIATQFAKHGANVAFTYHSSADKAKKLVKELEKQGGTIQSYQCDAADYEETGDLIQQVQDDFDSIDVVVNNAGITQDNLILRMQEEQWDKVVETNLKSVFNTSQHLSRLFLKQKGGNIINITSVVGLTGNAGQSNYAASKAGIIGFTKSMSKELASRNVRCNAIAPGFIETEMTEEIDESTKEAFKEQIPLQRYGSTEEVANVVLFLASDMSSYINGQVISVCGGLYS